MKVYQICVGSHPTNNSDYVEYDNYYTQAKTHKEALEYAKKCIDNWNKQKQGITYNIFNVTPHN